MLKKPFLINVGDRPWRSWVGHCVANLLLYRWSWWPVLGAGPFNMRFWALHESWSKAVVIIELCYIDREILTYHCHSIYGSICSKSLSGYRYLICWPSNSNFANIFTDMLSHGVFFACGLWTKAAFAASLMGACRDCVGVALGPFLAKVPGCCFSFLSQENNSQRPQNSFGIHVKKMSLLYV